jgi:aminoglycoside phosphotransferase (APT) family kinase protein
MARRTATVDGDLQRLLDQAVERTRIGVDDGKSGSPVERLRLADGQTVVVKRVRPYGDWIMRAMHDEGRAARLWQRGILGRVPGVIDHAVLGVVPEDGGWLVVMRDAAGFLVPRGHVLTRDQSRRVIGAVHALHESFAGEDLPGLAPLADRYTVLGPALAVRERDGADGVPKLVERGWDRFAERVAPDVARPVLGLLDDPGELVAALERFPQTLVHGDLKIPNLGLAPDRVVVIDWGTQTGLAPPAVEWAWYLAISAGRIAATREEILDDVQAAEGEAHDRAALSVAVLGAFVQLGWNKALDAYDHPDPVTRARERLDLEWWVRTARGVLDAWPL